MSDSNREALLLLNSVLEGIYEKKGENSFQQISLDEGMKSTVDWYRKEKWL